MINDEAGVLLSDEYRFNMCMTKFPGGGMKFGEGPEDCMRREAIEEFGQPVEILNHFYTTGFYQKAMFFQSHQLISIYYRIKPTGKIKFHISDKPFDFPADTEGSQSFRWQNIKTLKAEELSFPVDRFVAGMLQEQYREGLL
ncbi:MAG: NUDIX domain-containing protein [Bacteroidales bacterium]